MQNELPVHVSRDELHSLEVPPSFEADGPFDVTFVNHGTSLHVHLHLDDDLSEAATVDATNHYIEGESRRTVGIDVDTGHLPEGGIDGKLKVVSAYGSETRWVDLRLVEPDGGSGEVEVGESLGQPQSRETASDPLPRRPELPVLVLGGVALAVAALAAVVIRDTLVVVGSLAVVAGVLVALYVLSAQPDRSE